MELTFAEVWEFFHFPIAAGILGGIVCPLIGCFLLVRGTGFYGITLPQLAACGVAFGFVLLPWWVEHIGLGGLDVHTATEDTHAAMNYHLGMAATFTFGGLAILQLLRRRERAEAALMAATFAIASGATVLFAHASPLGEIFVHEMLRGEILTIGLHEFETLAAVLILVALVFLWFQRDLLLVSFDPETARVMGKPVSRFETLLGGMVGLTVTVGTLTLGPVVLFGLLVLPPLAARRLAGSMTSYYALSAAGGVIAVTLGFAMSFGFDFPLGPCVVMGGGVLLVPAFLFGRG